MPQGNQISQLWLQRMLPLPHSKIVDIFKLMISVTTNDGFSNIDWQNLEAVRALNKALLSQDWGLEVDMKEGRLCPPVCLRLSLSLAGVCL